MIPPDLETLLRPLERFEAIRRRVVFLGDRLADLSYANPYAEPGGRTRALLRETLEERRLLDLQYTPVGGQAIPRRMVAAHLTGTHGLPFTFDDVVLTPGATAALHAALRAASQPGGEVIMPVPCWQDYPLYAVQAGLTPVLVPLAQGPLALDLQAIADAITPRTRAVVLSHPGNPTGRNYGVDQLDALGGVLELAESRTGRPVTLIADEVHRDFIPPGAYVSAATAWPRTLMIYSFGKYHLLQGQRLGYVAVSPRHPERRAASADLIRWMRILGFLAPTTLMQRAVPGLLGLRHDLTGLAAWRARFVNELSLGGYDVAPSDGTFFLYVRTPGGASTGDFEFVEQLAGAGVLVLPAPVFHHHGYFRVSLTGADSMLERALATLCLSPALCPNCA